MGYGVDWELCGYRGVFTFVDGLSTFRSLPLYLCDLNAAGSGRNEEIGEAAGDSDSSDFSVSFFELYSFI